MDKPYCVADLVPEVWPTRYQLARALGLGAPAIYAWGWDRPIPALRQYQVAELLAARQPVRAHRARSGGGQ